MTRDSSVEPLSIREASFSLEFLSKFPTQRDKEFWNREQGTIAPEQGILLEQRGNRY